MIQGTESHLSKANQALRDGNFEGAIELYNVALSNAEGPLVKFIQFNLAFAVRRVSSNKKIKETSSIEYLRLRIKLINDMDVVRSNFDHDYYLEKNKDVADCGLDPVEHFCTFGWQEGRDPLARHAVGRGAQGGRPFGGERAFNHRSRPAFCKAFGR